MLEIIHRAALEFGANLLWKLFRVEPRAPARALRNSRMHNFQIAEWPKRRSLDIMRRSALGMIRVYNLLHNDCVSVRDVSGFHKAPTQLVRDRLVAGDAR